MDFWTLLALVALILAALPFVMGAINLAFFFRRLPKKHAENLEPVSVLIPARNEAERIGDAVRSILDNEGVEFELVVYDDASTDGTSDAICKAAQGDTRIRVIPGGGLPEGWAGKTHGCHRLSEEAKYDLMVFLDADVRLSKDAIARISAHLGKGKFDLVSGFPKELTGTFAERLVIPMIHFLLVGFLPMAGMKFTRHPGFGAGCGQLMAARREAYETAGGHEAVKLSLHDGVTLPRAFRNAGYATDAFDASDIARCRMYDGFAEVWSGFMKNATEGMATRIGLPVWTFLLGVGHILPFILVPLYFLAEIDGAAMDHALGAVMLCWGYRILLALRLDQSPVGALLHPVGIGIMLAIQWAARANVWRGRSEVWRGRSYGAS